MVHKIGLYPSNVLCCRRYSGILIVCHIINWFIIKILEDDYPRGKITILSSTIPRIAVISLFCISVIVTCLIPSKQEAMVIMAGGKTLNFLQSDSSISKIPYQATKLVSDYMDKVLEDMKKKEDK